MGLCAVVQYCHDTNKKGEDKSHHIMTHILKAMAVLTPTLVLLQDAAVVRLVGVPFTITGPMDVELFGLASLHPC